MHWRVIDTSLYPVEQASKLEGRLPAGLETHLASLILGKLRWPAGGSADSRNGSRGIIYCLTKEDCLIIHRWLLQQLFEYGIEEGRSHVLLHHANMSEEQRRANVDTFTRAHISPVIVIATSCFGTGIDAPGVSFTVCIGGGYSVLDMHQALGRAGREGLPATCLVLWYDEHERLLGGKARSDNSAGVQDVATTAAGTLAFFKAALQGHCLRQHLASILDGALGHTCIGTGGQRCSSCEELWAAQSITASPVSQRGQSPPASGLSPQMDSTAQRLFQSQAESEELTNSNSFLDTEPLSADQHSRRVTVTAARSGSSTQSMPAYPNKTIE
jgi:superfamily II DNA helicase RecQ